MKIFANWSLPVAVSLLLHAILIALLGYPFANSGLPNSPPQTISVELLAQSPMAETKARIQKAKPILALKPLRQSAIDEQVAVPDPVPPEPVPVETKTATSQAQVSPQPDSPATENRQPALNVQPLGKLTRPPALLKKIEPVYPGSEQRAGSQAQVIAEVTIDEKGMVHSIKIVKSAGMQFDNAVIEALNKSLFSPGYIDSEAVAVRVLVPFRFNLK